MKKTLLSAFVLLTLAEGGVSAQTREINLKIVETSDVHGNFYPYDFMTDRPNSGSLARVSAFLDKERETYGDRLIYLDNGDILQGQPTAYYYNFVRTDTAHLAARMLNYMGCAAGAMGNHDVETGHDVYDRWFKECDYPMLGANIIDTRTGEPYLKPYVVLEREGVKVAVLGMLTSLIPTWLPENLWANLRFEELVPCAQKWMKVIQEKEKPDVMVGLFHSGLRSLSGAPLEDASEEVARQVPGFDVVLIGHDHRKCCQSVVNTEGKTVWIVDPASGGQLVGDVNITVKKKGKKLLSKQVEAKLTEVEPYGVSEKFMQQFAADFDEVKNFVSRKVGVFENTITSEEGYFGSSAFIDFIHSLQLHLADAEISFCAPLSFRSTIHKGDVYVRDMFNLYRFENMLYTMRLTGREIKDYLEMSYAMWTNQMKSPDDHIMLLDDSREDNQRSGFKNFTFNFDSAAGIRYTVDVTKPEGEKITIESMADGTPFEMDREYRVAVNSYRGNGGGDLLTKGAGIPADQLKSRIIQSTDKDLRFYMMKYIEEQGTVNPQAMDQWKLIPEGWAKLAIERDRKLLFGN